jgi:glycosyltransferase involved in cell wall biosynthesis
VNEKAGHNVLIVSQALAKTYTGWAKHTCKLLDVLRKTATGLDYEVLTSKGEANSEAFSASRIHETVIPYGTSGLRKIASGITMIMLLLFHFRRWDRLYFSNFYFPIPLVVIVAVFMGKRVVVRTAGREVTAGGWRGRLRRYAALQASAIVVLNSHVRQLLIDDGVAPYRLCYIPNGVDTARFTRREGARKCSVSNAERDEINVLFVGAVCERKGVQDLVEAVARVSTWYPQVRLTIVGPYNEAESTPEFMKSLHNTIDKLGVQDVISFVGRVTDVRPYYQDADIFVLPSYGEGMPNVLLEAMASRMPIIATAIPGIVDVLDPGRTGLMVSPGAVDELEEALIDLIEHKQRAHAMAVAAQEEAIQGFDIQQMARKYEEVIAEA